MAKKEFSIIALLKEGWELTKINIGFLVVYQIILFSLNFLFGSFEASWKMAPLIILGMIILTLGNMGLFQSALLLTTGNKPRFDELYRNWPQFPSWLIANILIGILFTIGLLLFVIPGLYVLTRYGLFPFFILDKKLGPLDAIKQAGKATQGVRWELFLLYAACLVLNLLGLLFFFVGVFITIPVTLIALATVYRQLTGQSKNSIQPADIE